MALPRIPSSPSLAPTAITTTPDMATHSATARTSTIIADALAVDRVDAAPAEAVNLFIADYDNNAGRVADLVTSPVRAAAARATAAAASAAAIADDEMQRLCPSNLPASPRRAATAPFPTPKRSKGTCPPTPLIAARCSRVHHHGHGHRSKRRRLAAVHH